MKAMIRFAMFVLLGAGLGLIVISAGWPAALGAFLMFWAHNVERH